MTVDQPEKKIKIIPELASTVGRSCSICPEPVIYPLQVTLKHAVEDIFSNPGYLLSQVSLRPDEDLSSAALNPQIPRLFAKVLEVRSTAVATPRDKHSLPSFLSA